MTRLPLFLAIYSLLCASVSLWLETLHSTLLLEDEHLRVEVFGLGVEAWGWQQFGGGAVVEVDVALAGAAEAFGGEDDEAAVGREVGQGVLVFAVEAGKVD